MNIKLIAMDLDGTLSQHKSPLPEKTKQALLSLSKKYKLVMVGAGQVMRIWNQMEQFPIDIIGNYGLQYAEYDTNTKSLNIKRDLVFDCDRESVSKRVAFFREKYGFTKFSGESVEYHPSGCVTFAILGTKANATDKLSFDPDRKKRRAIYNEIVEAFPEYTVFVGGSSSFDMAPKPYDKRYALEIYCAEKCYSPDEVVFIGDDYGEGGNDESVYKSDFGFITIDDYRTFPEKVRHLLK